MSQGVIIGGGIAGISSALFLQQKNIHVPVWEKRQKPSRENNLLWIAPNGLHLLKKLNVIDDVKGAGVSQNAMQFSDRNLKIKFGIDGKGLIEKNDFSIIAIRREDLHKILSEKLLHQGGELIFDHSLSDIEVNPDNKKPPVSLSLSNGQTRSVDYVIAADGVNSKIRNALFSSKGVNYQGIVAWLGRVKCNAAKKYVGKTIEVWGVGTRFVLTSLDGETLYFSALERIKKLDYGVPDNILSHLKQQFSYYHNDIVEALQNTQKENLFRSNFLAVDKLNSFHNSHVCLLGDAAHAMPPNMGQGASLALEDAYIVSQLLEQNSHQQRDYFDNFTRLRKSRVKKIMGMANSMNVLFQPKSPLASQVRDHIFAFMPEKLNQASASKIYQFPIADNQ